MNILIFDAVAIIVLPSLALFLTGRKLRAEFRAINGKLSEANEYRVGMDRLWYMRINEAREAGRKEAIDSIEKKYLENPTAGYRNAIASYQKTCAHCKRACIHCGRGLEPAKENK